MFVLLKVKLLKKKSIIVDISESRYPCSTQVCSFGDNHTSTTLWLLVLVGDIAG